MRSLIWITALLVVSSFAAPIDKIVKNTGAKDVNAADDVLAAADFEKAEGSEVIRLFTDNFFAATVTGDWFIKFFSPRCGHCIRMAPDWEEFAKKSKENGEKTFIAEVDCTDPRNAEVVKVFNIRAYPTLILIRDGKTYEYRGGRSADKFTSFIQSEYATYSALERPDLHLLGKHPSEIKEVVSASTPEVSSSQYSAFAIGLILVLVLFVLFVYFLTADRKTGSKSQ